MGFLDRLHAVQAQILSQERCSLVLLSGRSASVLHFVFSFDDAALLQQLLDWVLDLGTERRAETEVVVVGSHVHHHEEADAQFGLPRAGAAAHEQAASH